MASVATSRSPQSDMKDLPSRWNTNDAHGSLELTSDGLEVDYPMPPSQPRDPDPAAVRADRPLLPRHGICYYEVTILRSRPEDTKRMAISVGLSNEKASLERLPGWESESWGYHGDDGRIYASSSVGKQYGPRFGVGDVIGCGIDFRKGCLFFTLNGTRKDDIPQSARADQRLYPCVGIRQFDASIRANFGASPFVFNIDGLLSKEKSNVWKQIDSSSVSRPGPGELDILQKLVLQFLQHDGYAETARALANDIQAQQQALCIKGGEGMAKIDLGDDGEVLNRQKIRRAIMEGDIDGALKHTTTFYEGVLKNNSLVYFRLRCRKFIELVRQAIELRTIIDHTCSGGDASRVKACVSNGSVSEPQDMDLDNSDRMDTDKDGNPGGRHEGGVPESDKQPLQQRLKALEEETINYGKLLRAEFGDDSRPQVKSALDEVFALLAYGHPEKASQVSYLLDATGRAVAAEELNSAILAEQGKPPRAAIENVWAQTSVLLEDLRKDGGAAAFLSLGDVTGMIC